ADLSMTYACTICFMLRREGKLACQTQLAFVKTSLSRMLFVALNAVYQKVVHFQNIVSVNTTKNQVLDEKRNPKMPESVNPKRGWHVDVIAGTAQSGYERCNEAKG